MTGRELGLHKGAFEIPASKIIKVLQAAIAGLECDPTVTFHQHGAEMGIQCSAKNGSGYVFTLTAYLDNTKGGLGYKCHCVKMETIDFLA